MKKNGLKENGQSCREIWDTTKHINICMVYTPEKEATNRRNNWRNIQNMSQIWWKPVISKKLNDLKVRRLNRSSGNWSKIYNNEVNTQSGKCHTRNGSIFTLLCPTHSLMLHGPIRGEQQPGPHFYSTQWREQIGWNFQHSINLSQGCLRNWSL